MNIIVPDLDTFGVPLAPPVQSAQLERGSNKRMNRVPVLNVEEIDTLAEYVYFVICLDPQALPCVQAPVLELEQMADLGRALRQMLGEPVGKRFTTRVHDYWVEATPR